MHKLEAQGIKAQGPVLGAAEYIQQHVGKSPLLAHHYPHPFPQGDLEATPRRA